MTRLVMAFLVALVALELTAYASTKNGRRPWQGPPATMTSEVTVAKKVAPAREPGVSRWRGIGGRRSENFGASPPGVSTGLAHELRTLAERFADEANKPGAPTITRAAARILAAVSIAVRLDNEEALTKPKGRNPSAWAKSFLREATDRVVQGPAGGIDRLLLLVSIGSKPSLDPVAGDGASATRHEAVQKFLARVRRLRPEVDALPLKIGASTTPGVPSEEAAGFLLDLAVTLFPRVFNAGEPKDAARAELVDKIHGRVDWGGDDEEHIMLATLAACGMPGRERHDLTKFLDAQAKHGA